jgi:hypothetical protein
MNEVGIDCLVMAAHGMDVGNEIQRIEAAAPPDDGMQAEALRFDGGRALVDVGDHVDLVAGALGFARHRQPVRKEIPVLRHQIDQNRPRERRIYT